MISEKFKHKENKIIIIKNNKTLSKCQQGKKYHNLYNFLNQNNRKRQIIAKVKFNKYYPLMISNIH